MKAARIKKVKKDVKRRSFEEAKKEVRKRGFKNKKEFKKWAKSDERPKDIPTHPEVIYKNEGWISWPNFLGYEGDWNVERVKELLRALIKNGTIYEADDLVLHSLLAANGLLNLHNNRHSDFFKNLPEARHTTEGLKAITEHAFSDSEEPPELEGHGISSDEDIQTASMEELKEIVKDETDPLAHIQVKPLDQLLRDTERLDSYTMDEEKMKFLVNYSVRAWWSRAFAEGQEEITVQAAINEPKKDKYHDEVINSFLSDYDGAKSIQLPAGYAFKNEKGEIIRPTLMQKYIAYKVKTQRRFGNFSGVGAGKTLSAILTSREIDSKLTVILCPNAIVKQWKENIETTFPDSVVMTSDEYDKKVFYAKREENKHKHLVINYDKFSQDD